MHECDVCGSDAATTLYTSHGRFYLCSVECESSVRPAMEYTAYVVIDSATDVVWHTSPYTPQGFQNATLFAVFVAKTNPSTFFLAKTHRMGHNEFIVSIAGRDN
jgi:hypothetical protein